MCSGAINLKNEDDLFFVITNTILSFDQKSFTEKDIIVKLQSEHPDTAEDNRVPKYIREVLSTLIESGKIIEEPRVYRKIWL